MKKIVSFVTLVIAFNLMSIVASAQKATCSCKRVTEKGCQGEIRCSGGCTALCGGGSDCSLWCQSALIYVRLSVSFHDKTGKEIAAALEEQSHRQIVFKPYRGNEQKKFNLEMKADDVWNGLRALDRLGSLIVGGTDFHFLKRQRNRIQKGEKLSVKLDGPVSNALDKLSFVSGRSLRVKSGDPEKAIKLVLKRVTFSEILSAVSKAAGVVIEDEKRLAAQKLSQAW